MDNNFKAKATAITLFLITGTISTFAFKLQGSQHVTEGTHEKFFFHPYMQSFTMFLGESFCILIYLINRSRSSKGEVELEEGKKAHQFYIFFIPAMADSCSSMLQYMGLSMISGSTYLMIKGASIITTAIFSKLLFNMSIERRHVAGCGLAIIGLVVVGGSGLFEQDEGGESNFSKQLVGYVIMLISLVFNGFLYAYEAYLMKKHTIDPLQMVGFEGIFGLFIITFVSLAFSIIPCGFEESKCVYDQYSHAFLERIDVFFQEIFSDYLLLLLVVVGILTISIYNLNGVRITKLIDPLTRSLLNITKTSAVWGVGVLITVTIGASNKDYDLESLDAIVNVVKAGGFFFIIVGTLIYNRLICKDFFALKIPHELHETMITSNEISSEQIKK